ncbi:MAG: D-alanyl-D-alanine carboxypeptidase/D-alanyl-D-alanine-endopeptidase [Pseudomonadota bacterium]
MFTDAEGLLARPRARRAAVIALAAFWGWPAQCAEPPADKLDTGIASRFMSALGRAGIPRASTSLLVTRADSGDVVAALSADVPRNPASVMKMVTTFVALDTLGPGYRWRTEAFSTDRPDAKGHIGDLYLRGNGNPFWVTDEFNAFVRNIAARGVAHIDGDLVLDRSYYFVAPGDPGAFDGEPFRVYNALPTPLTLNFNAITLSLVPNVAAHRLDVRMDPPVTTLEIDNQIALNRRPCEARHLQLRLDMDNDRAGLPQAVLSGRYPNRCRYYELTRALLTPTAQLVGAFDARWTRDDRSWKGNYREGVVPDDAIAIYEQRSRTLAEVARSMNKFSNNVMARQIFLTLGAEATAAPATLEKARAAVLDVLARHRVDTDGLIIDNGSGLSREARISAHTLMGLLQAAQRHRYAPEFFAAMPVPGVDGTLAVRFPEPRFEGEAHVKTGTLDDVIGLAGHVRGANGQAYLIVLLINHKGIHLGTGRSLQKVLLRAIVPK